jgi:hypothetical protein
MLGCVPDRGQIDRYPLMTMNNLCLSSTVMNIYLASS